MFRILGILLSLGIGKKIKKNANVGCYFRMQVELK
jgi:hypothetical protein